MAEPTQASCIRMKRLRRYLLGAPRRVSEYKYEGPQERIVTWTDADFAGHIKGMKSTWGDVVMHRHLVNLGAYIRL